MSKEKQIKEALACHADERNSCDTCPYKGKGCSLRLSHDALVHINELSTNVGCKSEWISVSERLPDKQAQFLIVDDEGYMEIALWTRQFGWFSHVNRRNKVTHWMPLPEAPKMKGGAE